MMHLHSHRRSQKKIKTLFTQGLSGKKTRQLWSELEQCPSCAALYEKYHALEASVSKPDAKTTLFAQERVATALFDAMPSRSRQGWQTALKGIAVLAAGTAALLVFMILQVEPNKPHRIHLANQANLQSRELVPRGATHSSNAHVGIRVFALSPHNDSLKENNRLFMNDLITFTYTNAKKKKAYLTLFSLQQPVHEPLWYYPDLGQGQSIPISGNVVDEPLGDGIDLSANHQPGWLRVISLFSDAPLSTETVASAAKRLKELGKLKDVSSPLPLDGLGIDAIEYSILLKIEETDESHF